MTTSLHNDIKMQLVASCLDDYWILIPGTTHEKKASYFRKMNNVITRFVVCFQNDNIPYEMFRYPNIYCSSLNRPKLRRQHRTVNYMLAVNELEKYGPRDINKTDSDILMGIPALVNWTYTDINFNDIEATTLVKHPDGKDLVYLEQRYNKFYKKQVIKQSHDTPIVVDFGFDPSKQSVSLRRIRNYRYVYISIIIIVISISIVISNLRG